MFKKLVIMFFFCTFSVYAQEKSAPTREILPSAGLSLIKKATFVKPVNPNKYIEFVVWLKIRNKEQLDKLIPELYDPNNPNYQKFLTGQQYDEWFAPSPEVENKIKNFFVAQGMKVKLINHSLRIKATVQQIEHTFKVKMNYYRFQQREDYAPSQTLTLSSDIAQHILEITGLNNILRFYPMNRIIGHSSYDAKTNEHAFNLKWDSFLPLAQPTTTSFNGFTGRTFRTAYNLNSLSSSKNGAGQTVVIIGGCSGNIASTIQSDANSFLNASSITPLLSAKNFTAVIDRDGHYTPYTNTLQCNDGNVPTGWESELALDVEASRTMAPGANTVLVLSPHPDTLNGEIIVVSDVIYTLTHNNHTIGGFNNASVVSNSWGMPESSSLTFPSIETVLQAAAASGINFNYASGDCGDNVYINTSPEVLCEPDHGGTGLAPNYPASSAFVTAVGGTSLFVDTHWNYAFESGWGIYFEGQFSGGSTGGISLNNAIPFPSWQSSIGSFIAGGYHQGSINSYYNCGSDHNQICRAVPDLAMLADQITGLIIYFSNGEGGTVPTVVKVGGTSISAPLYSGVLALVNQQRTLLGKGPIGLSTPYLYNSYEALASANAIHLITPPHSVINGTMPNPAGAPLSAFTLGVSGNTVTFGWDSSLTVGPENQFWNDVVGIGSPNIPNFVTFMAAQ